MNTPSMADSSISMAIMYSFRRSVIEFQEARIARGMMKVVSR